MPSDITKRTYDYASAYPYGMIGQRLDVRYVTSDPTLEGLVIKLPLMSTYGKCRGRKLLSDITTMHCTAETSALDPCIQRVPARRLSCAEDKPVTVSVSNGAEMSDRANQSIDEVRRLSDGSLEVVSRIIPYATSPDDACRRTVDCALTCTHDGPCYLTEWLFDPDERERLRTARGNT